MLGVANGFARAAVEGAGEGTGAGVDAGVGAGVVVEPGDGTGWAGRADGADLPPHAATTRRTNEREPIFTGRSLHLRALLIGPDRLLMATICRAGTCAR